MTVTPPDAAEVLLAAEALIDACTWVYEHGGAPATSGNFSVRLDADHVLITASGRHKGRLTPDDLLVSDLDGAIRGTAGTADTGKPSAETLLHLQLYRRDADLGAVLHVHTVAAMALSYRPLHARSAKWQSLVLEGWELQKAFAGCATHEDRVVVPVVANTQDMGALAAAVDAHMDDHGMGVGYLIAGHGLYTWGRDLEEARRHVEAFDTLLQCELSRRLLGVEGPR